MIKGKWQEVKVEDQYVLGADSGTKTFNLPNSNYLANITMRIQNTNGATSNGGNAAGETIEEDISKIEIVADGHTVYSCSGRSARKVEHYDASRILPADETQKGGATQYATFFLKFGEDRVDNILLLPAHRYSTLQLKVTWAFTDSSTAGYATSETNAKVDIMARYLVSKTLIATPFLKRIEHYNTTHTTTGWKTVDLPVGSGAGSYRRLYVDVYGANALDDGTQVDKMEVWINDSQLLSNTRWTAAQSEDLIRYGAVSHKNIALMLSNGDTYNSDIDFKTVQLTSCCCNVAGMDIKTGDRLQIALVAGAGTVESTDKLTQASFFQDGVSYGTVFDFGTDNIKDAVFVGEGSGVSSFKLKLNVNSATINPIIKVVTEQLVML